MAPSLGSRDLEGDAAGTSGSQQALYEDDGAPAGPGLFQNLPHMNNDYSVMMYVSGVISKVPPCCPPQPLICSCGPRASTSLG